MNDDQGNEKNPKPYLFLWNPKKDIESFNNYDEILEGMKFGFTYITTWICPSTKPQPGDIAIMQRTGPKNNGIFGRGIVTSAPYQLEDETRIIELELDSFMPIGKEILKSEIIERSGFEGNWQPMASGNIIPSIIMDTIDALWNDGDYIQKHDAALSVNNDLIDIIESAPETEKQTLISARIGQGKFRQSLLEKWDGRCAITGCSQIELLRASHAKPWCISSNEERLDQNNGILLSANFDALFDAGLISIDDDGTILISLNINEENRSLLNIPESIIGELNHSQREYLQYHRKYIFLA